MVLSVSEFQRASLPKLVIKIIMVLLSMSHNHLRLGYGCGLPLQYFNHLSLQFGLYLGLLLLKTGLSVGLLCLKMCMCASACSVKTVYVTPCRVPWAQGRYQRPNRSSLVKSINFKYHYVK